MGWEENTIKWLGDRAADCEHKDKTWLGEDCPVSSGYHDSLDLISRLRATIEAKDRIIKAWEDERVSHASGSRFYIPSNENASSRFFNTPAEAYAALEANDD